MARTDAIDRTLTHSDGSTDTITDLNGVFYDWTTFSAPNVGVVTSDADSLAIPVTHQFVDKTTGVDAEALTLADGVAGQELCIELGTDGGGDGTLTPTTCTGFATIVFADAGDRAILKYIDDTIGWVIIGLVGATFTTA